MNIPRYKMSPARSNPSMTADATGEWVRYEDVKELERTARLGEEITKAFLPVLEASRPLVLNLERLRDMNQAH